MCEPIANPAPSCPFRGTTYEVSPEGWWTEYGGALDVTSGVVFIPQGASVPPCPFPCDLCVRKGRTDGTPNQ